MTKRIGVIVAIVLLGIFAVVSAGTVLVEHDRDRMIRAADAGSGVCRALILGANFWARYFMFCTVGSFALSFFVRRISMEMGRW